MFCGIFNAAVACTQNALALTKNYGADIGTFQETLVNTMAVDDLTICVARSSTVIDNVGWKCSGIHWGRFQITFPRMNWMQQIFNEILHPFHFSITTPLVIDAHTAIDVWECHDDVIIWKLFPRSWPFVRGIHRSQVNSPHKGPVTRILMYFLSWACISC